MANAHSTLSRHAYSPAIWTGVLGRLTLETATLVAAPLAIAAVAQRHAPHGNMGVAAAPAILVLGAAAWFLSHRIALILTPDDPQWTPAHQRWTALVGLAIGLFLLAGRDRIRTGRNATGTHPAQPVNSTAQPTTTKPTVEVQHHGSQ